MAGTSGGQFVRLDPAACNALEETAAGLRVPEVLIGVDPGLKVTPPADGDCPQAWRIGVDGAWVQTPALDFGHPLTGGQRVWEVIMGVPALTIPRAGVWEVNYQVRGVATPATQLLAATDAGVLAAMYKNGAVVPGTETMAVYVSQPAGDPSKQVQATGCRQFMHSFAAGDTVRLGAARLGNSGTALVASNADGRTSITAHWVAPEGDTPA